MTTFATPATDGPKSGTFEVATIDSDEHHAAIRVHGELDARTVPLLLSVLRAHVRAARRELYLRLDAAVTDPAVLDELRRLRLEVGAAGGELVIVS